MKSKFLILKLILIVSLFVTFSFADARPKIALVLSGGGARGGAHVGVLKVLEEKKIPIDFIVGTSMGAFVGGLYASGKSAHEIETLLTSTEWKKYIRTDLMREDTPMRKKETEYQYQGRLGLGIDVDNNLVLPTGVLKRQPMLLKFEEEFEHVQNIDDFSQLAIPFKAVATDIQNGEAVVLESGSLAKSVYASSSIPGGFQPININGLDLVDGGVSDNMPIGVAQKMGADIIIAVDVSEKFEKNLDVNSYFVVMGQLVNILMRKNANESISTLSEQDILITPNLEGFTGLDADKYKEIIQTGVEITNTMYESQLKHLSISDSEYGAYKNLHVVHANDTKLVDEIVIINPTYIGDEIIRKNLHQKVGQPLDLKTLRKDILHIYNMGLFDSINHNFSNQYGQNVLEITTSPSWDNHGEIRFSIGLEDDFDGHSAYSLKFGYTMFGLNQYGGEWKNDFEIGIQKRAYTEIYQPLGKMQRFYIKPSFSYGDINELVPASSLGFDENQGNVEMDVKRYGATLGLGSYLNRDYRFEVGISSYSDFLKIELLEASAEYDAVPIYAKINTDSLDNLNFPNTGFKANLIWTKEMSNLGSDYDYEQIYLDIEKPFNIGYHNITTYIKYGSTYEQDGILSVPGSFSLGGLFNLSGFVPYSLIDENMFLGVVKYRYQLKGGGFFGSLNAPLYLGFSAEIGNTWGKDEHISYHKLHKTGTVYLSADTVLGPFYIAYGFTNGEGSTTYLYLGEKF